MGSEERSDGRSGFRVDEMGGKQQLASGKTGGAEEALILKG